MKATVDDDNNAAGNITKELLLGATPQDYVAWHIISKITVLLLTLFVLVTNSTVIFIYHQLRRRVTTMHEIHIAHLAVVDLLAGVVTTIPMVSGYIETVVTFHWTFYIVCFVASLSTHGCNVMATLICNIISYDRLRLLQLGIRYHLSHTRMFSIARIVIVWILVVGTTAGVAVFVMMAPAGQSIGDCAYKISFTWPIKVFMTIVFLGPLVTLVILNCMVRSKVQQLEQRHPKVANLGRSSSSARIQRIECENTFDGDYTSTTGWNVGELSPSSGVPPNNVPPGQYSTSAKGRGTGGSTSDITKSVIRSLKSDRSLTRKATTSIVLSTLTFIVCLTPLSALLLIEAWFPDPIYTSKHKWHMCLTLIRAAIDPFLFARSIPSFRIQYGTTVINCQDRFCCFRWLRWLFCYPLCFLDRYIIADTRERLDRKKRDSPLHLRQVDRNIVTTSRGEGSDVLHPPSLLEPRTPQNDEDQKGGQLFGEVNGKPSVGKRSASASTEIV